MKHAFWFHRSGVSQAPARRYRRLLSPLHWMTHQSSQDFLVGITAIAFLLGPSFGPATIRATAAPQLAQALPTPLPPERAGSNSVASEQYLVLVNGNSELLLEQVRQIEPGAFIKVTGGRSLIQAGRFNSFQNAQLRVEELATLGIGAQVEVADPVTAAIAVTAPGADAAASGVTAELPPLPVAATPATVEFGQAPPPASSEAIAPAAINTAPPPRPAGVGVTRASGYYVVVPAGAADLSALTTEVIGLGVPDSLVQARVAPRGPHLAIGPYADRGLAQEWSQYLRGYGLGARVHFE